MDTSTSTDLITLFRRVPLLLQACIWQGRQFSDQEEASGLRALRLVCKEASGVALLALRSFTLTLEGPSKCLWSNSSETRISGAKLLKGTQLKHLKVCLLISEEYSPASFVEDFSNEVDGALSSVTHLDLVYRRMRASALSLEGMNDAMALLVSKSPALKCLTCDGQLDPVFLQKMGEACPLITELTLAGAGAQSTLLEDLQSFTAALPRLNSLIFPGLFTLPDISLFSKIRSLELNEYRINADTAWLCLPSNLQYIKCHRIGCGPPALASGRHVLESLICLEVCSERIPLNALAQLLREAPSLKAVCTGVLGGGVLVIVCDLNSSTKDDLIVLSHNNEVAGITNAIINMSSSRNMIEGPLEAFAHGMPSMSGFQRCVFECQGSNLLPMLAVFPDVSNLRLTFAELVDDTVLQALASSSRLTHLEMEFCHHVSPTGLLLLSQNLPALQIVGIGACELLNGPAFESCVEMLTSNGSHLKLVDVGGGVFDDLRRSVTAFSRFR